MPKKIKTFDLLLLLIPVILIVTGVSVIFSLLASSGNNVETVHQIFNAVIGIILMLAVAFTDYRFFRGTNWIFYVASIILLLAVLFVGKTTNGATNWLDLKVFQLQPSEITKIFLIITLSSFFSNKIGKIRWIDILISFAILALPLALVAKEPDFGTAMIMVLLYFTMLFLSKPSKNQLVLIFSGIAIVLTIGLLAIFNVKPFGNLFRDYQRSRIMVFVNPSLDPLGRGYNVKQAQITIGSGGVLGKGLGKGTQSQLQFLPEAHTDFIFAGIAESFGFVGVFTIISLYLYFITRLIDIATLSRDNFGMLIVFGIASMFFFQALINIGMNIGLMPVTGIPLPFLSYGGTSLIISLFATGLVESIFIRHKKITF